MSQRYIPTIGLEIHAELKTNSKMFCSCKNDPHHSEANQNICSICLGHPGTLPYLNFEAIKNILKVGISINGTIADFTEWDRKHYFYPDIPKGYQISQYAYPLVSGGNILNVEIERIHLEEDTAKSTHDTHDDTLIDFNRSGVPLMELVTKPVIHDAKTAVEFAKELQLLIRYLDVGNANMEKGEMRVEANISVATEDDTKNNKFGTKTEVKNLNSFKAVHDAILYETQRQSTLLSEGNKVIQETRGWDEKRGETFSQRSKESSHDYRYFPDPDIPKLIISSIPELDTGSIRKELPSLPWQVRAKYTDMGASEKEAEMFVENTTLSQYFSALIGLIQNDKKKVRIALNYILSDYLGALKKKFGEQNSIQKMDTVTPIQFIELINMLYSNEINSKSAKEIIQIMIDDGGTPREIATKKNLLQTNDQESVKKIVKDVLSQNPKVVDDYRGGKQASLQFLMGQALKITKGSASPDLIRTLLIDALK